jgi:hypothetical protein
MISSKPPPATPEPAPERTKPLSPGEAAALVLSPSSSGTATSEPTLGETAIPAEALAFARKCYGAGPSYGEELFYVSAYACAISRAGECLLELAEAELERGGSQTEAALADLARLTRAALTESERQVAVKRNRDFLRAIRATASEVKQAKRIIIAPARRRPVGRRESRGCSTRRCGSRRTTTSTRAGPSDDSDSGEPGPGNGADHDRDHVGDRRLHVVGAGR